MSSTSKRLFVGTLLAPEAGRILFELKAELAPLFAQSWSDVKLRWVRPEKMHITWLFLGDCDEATQAAVQEILKKKLSVLSRFSLQYDCLELFGSRSRPRALVLSSRTATEEVAELVSLIRRQLRHFCQKKESESFRPHLTLLRFPHGYRGKIDVPELDLSRYLPLSQDISSISLIQSHMGEKNDSYEPLADYVLAAPK